MPCLRNPYDAYPANAVLFRAVLRLKHDIMCPMHMVHFYTLTADFKQHRQPPLRNPRA